MWQRLRRLFDTLVSGSPEGRQAAWDELCNGDFVGEACVQAMIDRADLTGLLELCYDGLHSLADRDGLAGLADDAETAQWQHETLLRRFAVARVALAARGGAMSSLTTWLYRAATLEREGTLYLKVDESPPPTPPNPLCVPLDESPPPIPPGAAGEWVRQRIALLAEEGIDIRDLEREVLDLLDRAPSRTATVPGESPEAVARRTLGQLSKDQMLPVAVWGKSGGDSSADAAGGPKYEAARSPEQWELLGGLLQHASPRIRAEALAFAWKVQEHVAAHSIPLDRLPATVESLAPGIAALLADPFDLFRAQAARVVGLLMRSPPPAILAGLARLLGDPVDGVRAAAARSVGGLGERVTPEMLTPLAGLLTDPAHEVRFAALAAVQQLGQLAATEFVLRQLADLLGSADQTTLQGSAGAIGDLFSAVPEGVRDALLRLVGDTDAEVCSAAVRALGAVAVRQGDRVALAAALRLFDGGAALAAVEAVGMFPGALPAEVIDLLAAVLGSHRNPARTAALHVIENQGPAALTREVLTGLGLMLDETHTAHETLRVVLSLRAVKVPELPSRLAYLVCQGLPGAMEGARLLGPKAFRDLMTAFADRFRSPERQVRDMALRAVGPLREHLLGPDFLDQLPALLADEAADTRALAAGAVEVLGERALTPAVVDGLNRLLRDPDNWARYKAEMAVRTLGAAARLS